MSDPQMKLIHSPALAAERQLAEFCAAEALEALRLTALQRGVTPKAALEALIGRVTELLEQDASLADLRVRVAAALSE